MLLLEPWLDSLAQTVATTLGQHPDDRRRQLLRSAERDWAFLTRLMRSEEMIAAAGSDATIKPYHEVVAQLWERRDKTIRTVQSIRSEAAQLRAKTNERLWIMSVIALRLGTKRGYSSRLAEALTQHGWSGMTSDTIKERVSRFRAGLPARSRAEATALARLKFGILRFHFEEFKGAEHWKKHWQEVERFRRENLSANDAKLFQKLKSVSPEFHVFDGMITTMTPEEITDLKELAGVKTLGQQPLQSTRVRYHRRVRRAAKPQ